MKPLKYIAYALLVFGSVCEFAGVFILVGRLLYGDTDQSVAMGVLLLIFGTLNVVGFKVLQRGFNPRS